MNIGLLGTGRMGAAIAERLLDSGHSLSVWNRSPEKTAVLTQRGAQLAANQAEVVSHSDIILSVLTDAKAIDSAYSGPQGALAGDVKGKLFIEMSTVRPATQIALSQKIRAQHGALLECPVGGTVGPARTGKLLGFVGGRPEDVERARPLLEQMCRRFEHVGDVGAGASMKLAINLPLLVYWQALGEALALAKPAGLSPERMLDILSDTSGAPAILKVRSPAIVSALSGARLGAAQFNIASIRKDLRTMIEEAQALGYELPTATAALSSFDSAAADGMGSKDGSEFAAWWLAHAGAK
jgi:3-hydroxyisobutyrate dehydrogenase